MKLSTVLLAGAAMVAATGASAQTTKFYIDYSGKDYGNNATATGSFDINDSALAYINNNPDDSPAYSNVSNLTLTVSGASAGNGSFTTSDFTTFYFNSPSALDFSKQLIGQALSNGFTYGDRTFSGETGDFNLFGKGSVPAGTYFFELHTSGGEQLALTSITSVAPTMTGAVPEAATWAMMLVGFFTVGAGLRYRRKSTAVRFA